MSDILEAMRNIREDDLEVARDVLETLLEFTEKYEPYATEFIKGLNVTLDQMPCAADELEAMIDIGVKADVEQESE